MVIRAVRRCNEAYKLPGRRAETSELVAAQAPTARREYRCSRVGARSPRQPADFDISKLFRFRYFISMSWLAFVIVLLVYLSGIVAFVDCLDRLLSDANSKWMVSFISLDMRFYFYINFRWSLIFVPFEIKARFLENFQQQFSVREDHIMFLSLLFLLRRCQKP